MTACIAGVSFLSSNSVRNSVQRKKGTLQRYEKGRLEILDSRVKDIGGK